jgi:hypothetical protein
MSTNLSRPFGRRPAGVPDDPVRRVVELSMEDLKKDDTDQCDASQTFLDPQLLNSQSIKILPAKTSSGSSSSRGILLNDTVPVFPIFQTRENKPITENVIEKMLMKKDGPLSSKASTQVKPLSVFGLNSNSKITSSLIDDDDGFSSNSSQPQFGLVGGGFSSSVSVVESKILPMDNIFSQQTQQSQSQSLLEPKPLKSLSSASSSGSSIFSRKSVMANANMETKEQRLKNLILQLKPHMTKSMENLFKALISTAKSVGGMTKVTQVSGPCNFLQFLFYQTFDLHCLG